VGAAANDTPAVVVDGVSKSFYLPHELTLTLKERALHPLRKSSGERLRALRDISFTVQRGEFFGIVGRNGSGKSTLLKCLAGIYGVDGGNVWIDGRLSPFIELGVGFNHDLAARDNVYLNAIMLGLTPKRAREIFDPVMEFAELEPFADLKLKNYSSGMLVRLAFSVMVQVEADVLVIDEILAVGDAAFQQKCFDVFYRLKDEGKTILLVTHDMGAVQRFCHRAMLIEQGDLITIGDPAAVASHYLAINFRREEAAATAGDDAVDPADLREGDDSASIVEAWIEDEHEARRGTFAHGEQMRLRARVQVHESLSDPIFSIVILNEKEDPVFAASSMIDQPDTGSYVDGQIVEVVLDLENAFAPGRYSISVTVAHKGTGTDVIDRAHRLASFLVASPRAAGGLVDLPHELHVAPVSEPARAKTAS
jgi:ABC-type polysaccharide/polyol phosphate transport system ATPase subunit